VNRQINAGISYDAYYILISQSLLQYGIPKKRLARPPITEQITLTPIKKESHKAIPLTSKHQDVPVTMLTKNFATRYMIQMIARPRNNPKTSTGTGAHTSILIVMLS
jgi:hypothetical protein